MGSGRDPGFLPRLEKAAENLPPLQLEIFLAHRLDGLSCAEIARRTGLSGRAVERQLARALWKIDRHLAGRPLRWWHRWL